MIIKVGIIGAEGRMGKEIRKIIAEEKDIEIKALVEKENHPAIGKTIEGIKITSDLEELKNTDVIVEFTHPSVSIEHARYIKELKKKYILGTTGFTKEQIEELKQIGKEIALVYSPNMSLGVNLLFKLVELTAKILPEEFDAEIVELHHRKKKDAPSGTALKIAEIIKKERNLKEIVFSRQGVIGERKKDEIGILAVRAGDIPGEHMVIFAGEGERIELIHRAGGRRVFAKGVIKAIRFIVNKERGFYSMQDVIGFS